MTWIRTEDRLPTWEDAGDWDEVNVLVRPEFTVRPSIRPFMLIPDAVNERIHSHWAKLPDAPEGE